MLVYENNHPGTVQAYTDKSTLRHEGLPKEWGEKPLLIHSAVPAQPPRGEGPTGAASARGHPGAAGTPAAGAGSRLGVPGSYLHTHLGFQREKQKVSSKSAGKFNADREGSSLQSPAAAPTACAARRPAPQPGQRWAGNVPFPSPPLAAQGGSGQPLCPLPALLGW